MKLIYKIFIVLFTLYVCDNHYLIISMTEQVGSCGNILTYADFYLHRLSWLKFCEVSLSPVSKRWNNIWNEAMLNRKKLGLHIVNLLEWCKINKEKKNLLNYGNLKNTAIANMLSLLSVSSFTYTCPHFLLCISPFPWSWMLCLPL
jgi:hypothetical protein